MQKSTLTLTCHDGRLVGGAARPLHLRIEQQDGVVTRVALGVEAKGGVSWNLHLTPAACAWIADRVSRALIVDRVAQGVRNTD